MRAAAERVDREHRWLTLALAVLTLAFAMLPPGLVLLSGELKSDDELAKGLLVPVQWPLLFLVGPYLVARRLRLAFALLPWVTWALPLLLGWFLASTLWSAAPGDTARGAMRLAGLAVCAFAWTLASWEPGRYWRLARYTLGLLVALSVVVAVAVPEIGTHGAASPEVGKWRGLTTHKNLFGSMAGIGTLLWLHAWAAREVPLRRALPWLAVCGVALLGARSTTSVFATLVGATVLLVWLRSPTALRGGFAPVAIVLLFILALPLHVYVMWHGAVSVTDVLAPVVELIGKDVTLTGRADLWRYLFEEIPRHPWLGVGHGAYWLGEWSRSGYAVRELYWAPDQGHNFYLDLLNESGAVGVALFAALLVAWARTLLRVARVDRPLAVLNGGLLAFLLVLGLTETVMLRATTAVTVLMFFALFDMNRRLFEEALRVRRVSANDAQLARAAALGDDERAHQRRERGGKERRRERALKATS